MDCFYQCIAARFFEFSKSINFHSFNEFKPIKTHYETRLILISIVGVAAYIILANYNSKILKKHPCQGNMPHLCRKASPLSRRRQNLSNRPNRHQWSNFP